MCFGNTTICRQCRKSRIIYREKCFRRLGKPCGRIRNHQVYGLRRFISQCPRCQLEEQCQQGFAPRSAYQELSLLRIREDAQSFVTSPTPPPQTRKGTAVQRNLSVLRRRFHPYRQGSHLIQGITNILNDQASSHPEEAHLLARWQECHRRQAEIDTTGRGFTEEDLQYHLSSIPGFEIQPSSPVYSDDSIDDDLEQFAEGHESLPSSPEDQDENPASFQQWVFLNDQLTKRASPRPADIALSEDITGYVFYLEQDFEEFYAHQFRQFVDEILSREHQKFNFHPSRQPRGITPAAPFRYFASEHSKQTGHVSHQERSSLWSEYAEYLRDLGAEDDARSFASVREDRTRKIRRYLDEVTQSLEMGEVFEELEYRGVSMEDTPQTFSGFTYRGDSPRSLTSAEQLQIDIDEHEDRYLGRGNFNSRYPFEFRDAIERLRQQDIANFNHTPLSQPEEARISFKAFLLNRDMINVQILQQDPAFPNVRNQWDIHQIALRSYGAYLSAPQQQPHFRQARNNWAEWGMRELQGLERDPFAGTGRFMAHEQRERLRDSIADLERAEAFMRAYLERHALPTDFQREAIGLMLHGAWEAWRESVRAVNAAIERGEQHPLTPLPAQTTFRRERKGSIALDISDSDIADREVLMQAEEEEDDISIVMGDEMDEEMSEPEWYADIPMHDTRDGEGDEDDEYDLILG